MKRLLSVLLPVFLFCCCEQGSVDNKSGDKQIIFIGKSFVAGPSHSQINDSDRVELKPHKAAVEFSQVSDNLLDLKADYIFAYPYSSKVKAFSVELKSVPVNWDNDKEVFYSVDAEHFTGSGTIDSDVFAFEDVSIKGKIGVSETCSLTVSGLVNGKEFTLIMESFTDDSSSVAPLTAEAVEVDGSAYMEIICNNESGIGCELTFRLRNGSNHEIYLAPYGEINYATYTGDDYFWGGFCKGVLLSFSNGTSLEFTDQSIISQQKEVADFFRLSAKGISWYLQGWPDGTIEKVLYDRECFSVVCPDAEK